LVVARAYNGLLHGLAWIAGISIMAMFVVVVVDVGIRATGLQPPRWSVPVTEYLILYFTMAAAPYVVRVRGHVFVEMLVAQLPLRARDLFGRFIALVCAAASLIATYYAAELVLEAIRRGKIDIRAIDIPLWLLYAPLPVGFLLVAVEFIIAAFGSRSLYLEESEINL
jgi:C4-dicarboxylate transporter DctQ subunit